MQREALAFYYMHNLEGSDVERELDALCGLSFQPDELAYLGGLRYMKSDFVDFLRIFQFQRDFIGALDGAFEQTLVHIADLFNV